MVKDAHPEPVKEAASTVLPVWLEAFRVLLSMDPKIDVENAANWDGLAIRIQVVKVRSLIDTLRTLTNGAHVDSRHHPDRVPKNFGLIPP